jgi:hypothetical protein
MSLANQKCNFSAGDANVRIMVLILMALSPAAFAVVAPANGVPEPSTLGLFAAAAVGAGIASRLAKRRRK